MVGGELGSSWKMSFDSAWQARWGAACHSLVSMHFHGCTYRDFGAVFKVGGRANGTRALKVCFFSERVIVATLNTWIRAKYILDFFKVQISSFPDTFAYRENVVVFTGA